MKVVEVIWKGPDDSMIPGVGVGMFDKPIQMPSDLALSYKATGLVADKAAASKEKTKEKDK